MKRYESYKDSDINWLGTIPENWEISRLKNLGNAIIGLTYSPDDIVEKEKGILVLRSSNIQNDLPDFSDTVYVDKKPKKSLITKSGDILICSRNGSRALIGKNIRIDDNTSGVTFGAFMTIYRSRYSAYLSYFFKSQLFDYQSGAFMTSTINQLTISTLNQLTTLFPPLEEQIAIAEYLDTKTQAIDKKISLLEKKIGYYQELRKSLINETVTKGLDKNTELKNNELGFTTPKSWLRYRLKDLGELYSGLSGKSGDDFNQDNNPDNKGFIPFTNIANNTYLKRDHLGTVVVYEGEKQNRVRKGDIFFLMSSEGYEDIGKSAALAEDIEETYLNSFCKGYRVNPRKTNPYFLNYLMLSDYYRQLLIVEGKGFTRINLKMEKVNDFLVYIPDTLSAQDEIVKFLDAKLDTIAKIIANIQTQITTLKELRKTLINDVVTGKIKVIQD
ncbi:MAG: restriction endonuclease subunit S [Bacteroidetes bacterium]|nr:restriction endonuclease subunit S [Bacteroidota bacterium]